MCKGTILERVWLDFGIGRKMVLVLGKTKATAKAINVKEVQLLNLKKNECIEGGIVVRILHHVQQVHDVCFSW